MLFYVFSKGFATDLTAIIAMQCDCHRCSRICSPFADTCYHHCYSDSLMYVSELMKSYIYNPFQLSLVKEGRKKMFYLTTHSTHFIYVIWCGTCAKGPVRKNPLPSLHGLLFPLSNKGSFICTIPQRVHTTTFVTPVVDHWLEREITQRVRYERTLYRSISFTARNCVMADVIKSFN